MILGEFAGDNALVTTGDGATLDDLFRRAGVRHPAALALADPPNRASFTAGAPRALTYAQADRAIAAFAARLQRLGLATDTVVALQLPNTVEGVIALLGVLRARMIAALVPLLWRQQDMVDGLLRAGAKVIVTAARIGAASHIDLAMQLAAELFPIRYVCAFGNHLPDGVIPLDDIFAATAEEPTQSPARPGQAAAHVAAITFDTGAEGVVLVARNHQQLVAGGLMPYVESGLASDAPILSAVPPSSFAGLSLTVLPWLLSGGTLILHHAFDPTTFATQCSGLSHGAIVLPRPALVAIAATGALDARGNTVIALSRSPERLLSGAPWSGAPLVDVACFGEIGLIAARRGADGEVAPIPLGRIGAPRGAEVAVTAIDCMRTSAGSLALRGPMVPTLAFPPGAENGPEPHLKADTAGFVESGYGCRRDEDTPTLSITGPRGGITAIGGYRFRQHHVDALIAGIDTAATIIAVPDALLGQRFAGSAADASLLGARLVKAGANPLIARAFLPRLAA